MKLAPCALVLLAAGAGVSVAAQPKPEDVIHYRQSAMTLIGWNFGPLAAMVKGKIPFDAAEFFKRADRIESLAPQVLEGFAKGSDKGAQTDAKADIWTHYDDFHTKVFGQWRFHAIPKPSICAIATGSKPARRAKSRPRSA
jgi:cytochrome c556